MTSDKETSLTPAKTVSKKAIPRQDPPVTGKGAVRVVFHETPVDENPEWTEKDFARAQGPEALPPEMRAAFPNTKNRGGRPRAAAVKVPVSIRLDAEVVEKFKATGPGWQSRMNEALRRAKV